MRKKVPQGGLGFRHQFNIADCGYGARGPRVYNDRAGEVGRTMNPQILILTVFSGTRVRSFFICRGFSRRFRRDRKICGSVPEPRKSTGRRSHLI